MSQPVVGVDRRKGVTWAPAYMPWAILAFMAGMLVLVHHRIYWTPPVLPKTANSKLFSEERALQHVYTLAGEIGDRQVSTPGLHKATLYMLQQLEIIKQSAANRHDVSVEVKIETVSGAVGMTFLNTNFTNAYRALDNLALVVTPKGSEHLQAVLMASHFDSAVCSQGASDDAAQAAVMLEVARALLVRPILPATPLVFLWTGGEEPISPAAHGWSTHSPLYPKLGAFINLEAMGGGGIPIVFQHTGSWVLEAYARGCPLARGSRVAQDIFDLQLIPADSDFRMFSARHYGSLPGLDIAFLIDSTAYHSYLDMPARLKSGILQDMGEAVIGGLLSVSKELASRQTRKQPVTPQDAADDAVQRSVYFDVLGWGMVIYSDDLASKLHTVPPAILLTLPMLIYPPARPVIRILTRHTYWQMFLGAFRALLSIVFAVAAPITIGVLRTLISGKPMVWFAQHWVGHIQFLPIAAVGALLPWLGLREKLNNPAPLSPGGYISTQLQGSALLCSIVGALLTYFGLTGNSMIFVLNGVLGIVTNFIVHTSPLGWDSLAMVLFLSAVPMAVGGSVVMVFISVMMERMALSGHVNVVLGEVVVGALSGGGVLAMSCGVFLPLLGCSIRGNRKLLLGLLASVSVGAAVWSSVTQPAYSPTAPKRVILSHLIETALVGPKGEGGGGAAVLMEVRREGLSLAGVDSTPVEKALNLSHFSLLTPSGREYTPLFPLDRMLAGITIAPPGPFPFAPLFNRSARYCPPPPAKCDPGLAEPDLPSDPLVSELPFVQLTGVEVREEAQGGGAGGKGAAKQRKPPSPKRVVRLHLRMFSQLPCWGILNVTAPGLVGWSFTTSLAPSEVCSECGGAQQHVVRYTTQDSDPYWPFWLDIQVPAEATSVPSSPTSDATGRASSASPASTESALAVSQLRLTLSSSTDDVAVEAVERLGLLAGQHVRIELCASYLHRTGTLRRVMGMMPGYIAETWMATVYQSFWEL